MRFTPLIDLRPLRRSPAFRRLWIASTAAGFGDQLATVAVLHQVWELTHSTVWTGAIGLATAIPTLAAGALGGTLADTLDRRRVVVATTIGTVATLAGLAVQAGLDTASVGLVLVLVAVLNTATATGAPARRTFITRLLPPDLVPAGVALNHVGFQVAMLVGPVVAGIVIASRGLFTAYVLGLAAVTVSLHGTARLPTGPGETPAGTDAVGTTDDRVQVGALRATLDGWRFIVNRPVVRGCLAIDLSATVLAMPIALFPAVNAERSGDGVATVGFFFSALAVGGVLAGLFAGVITRAAHPGVLMASAAGMWGVSLAAFGLVHSLPVTLSCLVVAGASDTTAVIARGTLVQLDTPDAYLGRVSAVENIVGVAGPGLGTARAGAVAGLTSAAASATSGGLACLLAVGVVAALTPGLRHWTRTSRVSS
ncbi:MAG: MFS transporter [Janthinobacterium lividum]